MIRRLAKAAIRKVITDYDLYTILRAPDVIAEPAGREDVRFDRVTDLQIVRDAPGAIIRDQAGLGGEEAAGFGAWIDGRLVSACWFWWGERYRVSRMLWPLADHEAKLVQIGTDDAFRGRHIAPDLIQYAGYHMRLQGAGRLYARVWHSNKPSIKAFRRAGWTPAAWVGRIALSPPRYYRLVLRWRPKFRITLSCQKSKGE